MCYTYDSTFVIKNTTQEQPSAKDAQDKVGGLGLDVQLS